MSVPVADPRGRGSPPPRDQVTPLRGVAQTQPVIPRPRPVRPWHGIEDQEIRDPGYINDVLVVRDHSANVYLDSKHGVGDASVDWTACGPTRPELHVRVANYHREAGASNTRYIPNPYDPSVGLHSRTAHGPRGNIQRYQAGRPTMRPSRQDRLTQARYTGQSYSQTTRMQGT